MPNAGDDKALEFEQESGDLMDEDHDTSGAQLPKLRSAITGKKTEGRGYLGDVAVGASSGDRNQLGGRIDSTDNSDGPGPQRSIEGYIILVTGVHEEAQEEDLQEAFGGFGPIKNLHLNLDRRTGFVKGYALIEYEQFEEAQEATDRMNGAELLGQMINVDWAFSKGPFKWMNAKKGFPRRQRSRSPIRKH